MFKRMNTTDAEFWRIGTQAGIDVFLPDVKSSIPIGSTIVSHSAKALSERELERVIELLSYKAKVMLKQRNFPYIYDEMLTDLITVYKERYGKQDRKGKNWKNHYTLSANQLKDLIEKRYTFNEVRIDSVSAGISESEATNIEVGSDGILYVSFSEVVGDE